MGFLKRWKDQIWFQFGGNESAETSGEEPSAEIRRPKDDDDENSFHSEHNFGPKWKDYLLLDRRARLVYVVILCFIVGLILPSLISYYLLEYKADLGNCNPPGLTMMECMSGSTIPVTQSSCEAAGCCFNNQSSPKCFHRNPTRFTYLVTDILESSPNRIIVDLTPERRKTDYYGAPLPSARMVIRAVNPSHLVVQLLSHGQSPAFRLTSEDQLTRFDQTDFEVAVSTEKKNSFGVVIRRAETGTVLFDTSRGPLIINDQYVEMSTSVPSEYVFGLGSERKISFTRSFNYAKTALYNRAASGVEGFHPFYMAMEPAGNYFYGVFWDNSYPLELQFNPTPSISFRAMGGSGTFHIFSGPTPSDVSRQYYKDIIGQAVMPPYWSLGFHMCRESDDPTDFTKTLDQMTASEIGFDSDCIDRRLSGPGAGQIDRVLFPQVDDDRQKLINLNKKFVLVQPPHMAEPELLPGEPQWIRWSREEGAEVVTGTRFDTNVTYPSFADIGEPEIDLGDNWRPAILSPDGFDLVDNWPSTEEPFNCTNVTRNFLPESLKNGVMTNEMLCLDAYHPNLDKDHLAVHNHYGIQHLNAIVQKRWGTRWLYLNRASALGNLGKAGYNGEQSMTANWLSMKTSLLKVLEMGLFGVPLSGSPICGTTNSSSKVDNLPTLDDEQLCNRWYQLGLLLPYAHSTSHLGHRLRSPVDWSLSSRRYMASYIQQRYRLLPYYYTLFHQATTEGIPVVRPMFYNFPQDNNTYALNEQFMIGDSLMVCPVMIQELENVVVSTSAYFPAGTWYDYYTGSWMLDSENGTSTTLTTGMSHINIFMRNGTVIVTQEPGLSAEDSRKNPYTVTAAFPADSMSSIEGRLFVDDGQTSDPEAYDLVHFKFTNTTFTMVLDKAHQGFPGAEGISTVVDSIRIFGITLDTPESLPSNAHYDMQTRVLTYSQLNYNWKVYADYELNFRGSS